MTRPPVPPSLAWNELRPEVRAARFVLDRLRNAGHEAYWVGGCVRDALLGLEPDDLDIATSATPPQIRGLFDNCLEVGAQFGVMLVIVHGVSTEVATFRTDLGYSDGRRPDAIAFGSADDDVHRRDFTINALLYDPVERTIVDYVGGRADLEAGILRAIGNPADRFREDSLRMLRAVRFATRFGLVISPETFEAIRANAPDIGRVSAERIGEELTRIFTGNRPGRGLELLDACGPLARVLPEVAAMKGVDQPERFHPEGDVFRHTMLTLEALPTSPSSALAFGALLHDVGKPVTRTHTDRIRFHRHQIVGAEMADGILRRLRLSNTVRKRVVELVRHHMRFMDVYRMTPGKLRRFLGMDGIEEHLALHRADCLACHGKLDNYDYCMEKLREFRAEPAGEVLPPPLISGHDLIARGHQPGPRMGQILDAVREAQLEGRMKTPEAALDWVDEHWPPEMK